MDVEHLPIESLTLDPDNARVHPERNLDAIKASLTKFGQQKPIVVDGDGKVVAGNGTLAAAQALGWPTIAVVRTSLTGADARAYALADNRTAELAEWDLDVLGSALRSLDADDYDFGAVGWSEDEVRNLMIEPDFLPVDESTQGKLDQLKPITCPECGAEFQR